jgi:hypothetical protein
MMSPKGEQGWLALGSLTWLTRGAESSLKARTGNVSDDRICMRGPRVVPSGRHELSPQGGPFLIKGAESSPKVTKYAKCMVQEMVMSG